MSFGSLCKELLFLTLFCSACANEQSRQQLISNRSYQTAGQSCSSGCTGDTTCDYQYYIGTTATCRPVCTTPGQQGSCTSGEICSPITSTCEPICNGTADCNDFFGQPGIGVCSSTSNGYCQVSCASDAQCTTFDQHLKCNTAINSCAKKCTGPTDCPGGQQCSQGGFCEFSTCSGSCTPPSLYQCANGFCLPLPCGTGPGCGAQGFCNSGTSCSCGAVASCSAPETCSAAGSQGVCQCGSSSSCASNGETCVSGAGGLQCQCGSTPGLSCGTGTCNSGGLCVCGGTTCPATQTCSLGGTCVKPIQCGGASCAGACVDGFCLTSSNGDGTCSSPCNAGQVCFSQQCLSPCGNSGNFCLASETCNNSTGQCVCGTTGGPCLTGKICAGPQGSSQCIQKQCGDGYATGSEVCDEGNGSLYPQGVCPNGWSVNGSAGPCEPKIADAKNGANGHCSTDCSVPCIVQTAQKTNYWSTAQLTTALGELGNVACTSTCPGGLTCANNVCVSSRTCSANTPCPVGQFCNSNSFCQINSWSQSSSTGTVANCPNGSGIWVSNGIQPVSPSINISNSVGIYGGFHGHEKIPADRYAKALGVGAKLGQNAPSGTILQGSAVPVLSIGDDATAIVVALDGFQILGGFSSATTNACNSKEQGAGGVTICKNATATLRNLRIADNSTNNNGGGIRNLGTMTLKDSMVSMNGASNNGGGISHESTSGAHTIERVTFFGNSAGLPTASTAALATNLGGAIFANGAGSTLNIFGTNFNANYSYGNGGGIYAGNTLNVISSLFASNWASNAGGGLYLVTGQKSMFSNLTMIDNAAYNQGGGAMFDQGTNSTLQNTLFRDNKGLYPVNSSTVVEWGGNRVPNVPVGAINPGASFSASSMSPSPNGVSNYAYIDICPTIAYVYNSGSSGNSANGTCSGGILCGTPQTSVSGYGSSVTYNTNAAADQYGSANQCNRAAEFFDCAPPLYRNCMSASGKTISGTSVTGLPYPYDLFGGTLTSNLGAASFSATANNPQGFTCCVSPGVTTQPKDGSYCAVPGPLQGGLCGMNSANPLWTSEVLCEGWISKGNCTYSAQANAPTSGTPYPAGYTCCTYPGVGQLVNGNTGPQPVTAVYCGVPSAGENNKCATNTTNPLWTSWVPCNGWYSLGNCTYN